MGAWGIGAFPDDDFLIVATRIAIEATFIGVADLAHTMLSPDANLHRSGPCEPQSMFSRLKTRIGDQLPLDERTLESLLTHTPMAAIEVGRDVV